MKMMNLSQYIEYEGPILKEMTLRTKRAMVLTSPNGMVTITKANGSIPKTYPYFHACAKRVNEDKVKAAIEDIEKRTHKGFFDLEYCTCITLPKPDANTLLVEYGDQFIIISYHLD